MPSNKSKKKTKKPSATPRKTTRKTTRAATSATTPRSGASTESDKSVKLRARLASAYAWLAIAVLIATTILWSWLGALTNHENADQLVNSYLFESGNTFEQAAFPAQHSFLLKWPLFWLIKQFGLSAGAFLTATIITAVITVSLLAWLLYRLERRPLYFGTLCLALTSALLLVPTQPSAGGLLPVNMAMTTTRNLEYIMFVAILVAATRLQTWRSWRFWGIASGLTLLIASDKLFMSLAAGGAILGGIIYIFRKRPQLLRTAAYTLLACAVATIAASLTLSLLNATGITHIVSTGGGAGPYSLALSLRNLALGSIYAIFGLFTNFGANPGYDATVLSTFPRLVLQRLVSPAGPAYLVNIGIVIAGFIAAVTIIRSQLHLKVTALQTTSRGVAAALSLIWASIAATGAFIITDHAYPVDARYVSIWLFALFVCLAVWLRGRSWPADRMYAIGMVLAVGVICGIWGAFQNYYSEKTALTTIHDRNQLVAQALGNRRTNILVGDYWRVIPTKAVANPDLTVLPLANCTTPRDALTSKAWEPDLHNHSFAYLLSTDKGLTDYPACSLQQVIDTYGRPSSSVVIAGKVAAPQEVLLFYDHGINPAVKEPDATPPQATASVIPLPLDRLPRNQASCDGRPTIMNIVAHQDDDLLFMNPNLDHDIAANHCVRTIYLTAGDAGSDQFYWLGRERGSQAAYDVMDGTEPGSWIQKIVNLTDARDEMTGQYRYLTIASPRNNPRISLIFLHLPDGGLTGQGFSRSHNESLARLESGEIGVIHTIDGQSAFTAESLTGTLSQLMQFYQPSEVRTQADYISSNFPDHSDHMATGHFASRAQQLYTSHAGTELPITYYLGYPVREQAENVSGHDLSQKESAFFAYGKFDGSVCQSEEACANVPTYYEYLRRQYGYATSIEPTEEPTE